MEVCAGRFLLPSTCARAHDARAHGRTVDSSSDCSGRAPAAAAQPARSAGADSYFQPFTHPRGGAQHQVRHRAQPDAGDADQQPDGELGVAYSRAWRHLGARWLNDGACWQPQQARLPGGGCDAGAAATGGGTWLHQTNAAGQRLATALTCGPDTAAAAARYGRQGAGPSQRVTCRDVAAAVPATERTANKRGERRTR